MEVKVKDTYDPHVDICSKLEEIPLRPSGGIEFTQKWIDGQKN